MRAERRDATNAIDIIISDAGCFRNRPPIPSNSALFEGTAILSGVRNHSGCSRVHSFNPTMHRKNECTTDVHSTARESP